MEYYSLNQYLRDTFGRKLYKIALDGGFTCPNRDGKLDTRGCIFCNGSGSGSFAQSRALSITEQLEHGKSLVSSKLPAGSEGLPCYIAYFQNFTGTYAPVERLRALYTEAISHPDVAVLSVATRPDCLPDEAVALLRELNGIKPVWVELGLQTIHPQTARWMRRGYELPVYDDAVRRLKAAGLQVIVHMILGLPGETVEDMAATAAYIGAGGADGIKLQLLHVLKGTDLAAEYEAGRVPVMSLEEYCHAVIACLKALPEGMVIHRITGDGDKRSLLDPLWSADKKHVLNTMRRAIEQA